jgi:hypothetical protein
VASSTAVKNSSFDNSKSLLRVTVPDLIPERFEDLDDGDPKYGIADA